MPKTLKISGKQYDTNTNNFAQVLHNYFLRVGEKLSYNIPFTDVKFIQFVKNNISSLVMDDILEDDISNAIDSSNVKSATGPHDLPIKTL